eukprot:4433976-Prymnesium_polylepis.1
MRIGLTMWPGCAGAGQQEVRSCCVDSLPRGTRAHTGCRTAATGPTATAPSALRRDLGPRRP